MSSGYRTPGVRKFLRTALALLMVELLTFPPGLSAASISWNGGTGNYSNPGNWTCNDPSCTSPVFPNNGNLGLTFDATINSGSGDVVDLDIVSAIVNSAIVGGSGPAKPSVVNFNGKSLTFGTPAVSSGSVLTVRDGGVLNIGSGSGTLELSGGGGALNDVGGRVGVTDGGTLTLRNLNAGGTGTLVNNGNLSVAGTAGAASLVLNGGSGSSFTLSGNGTLTLGGMGRIVGMTGAESLINDVSHTIAGDGVISGLTNMTNNGTLHATTLGRALIAGSNLTNWDSTTNTLTGGSYVVDNGSTLQLSGIGSGNTIRNLAGGAAVTLNGSGVLTGGGATNALTGLATVSNSSVTLNVPNVALGQALTVSAFDTGSGHEIAQFLLNSSNVTVAGDLNNKAIAPFVGTPSALVNLAGGSRLTVNGNVNNSTGGLHTSPVAAISLDGGSNLTVTGTFTNDGDDRQVVSLSLTNQSAATISGALNNFNGTVMLQNSSSLSVGQSLLNIGSGTMDDDRGSALLQLGSSSTAVIAGDLTNRAASFGDTHGSSMVLLSSGSSLTVQNMINENIVGGFGIANSQVELTGGSSLIVKGNLTNRNVFSTFVSTVDFSLDGSSMTVGGTFTNTDAPLSLVRNSTATVAGLFTSDVNSSVTLDSSTLIANGGFSNAGPITLNSGSKLAGAGTFSNSATVDLFNSSTAIGFLDNTGTLTLHGSGDSVTATGLTNSYPLTRTGAVPNPGVVSLNGDGDRITISGNFINSGEIDLLGNNASVSSGGFENQAGGLVSMIRTSSLSSTGTASNEGAISGGSVSSVGDFVNAATGTIDSLNTLSTQGRLTNAGFISVGTGSVTAGTGIVQSGILDICCDGRITVLGGNTFTQTGGTTSLGFGTLTAGLIDLQGGTLFGGNGTIDADLVNEGGTLIPFQTNVTGNYDQTLLGILHIDLDSASTDDLLIVGGIANLNGTLDLTLQSGFNAALGSIFHIISWNSVMGDFAAFNDPVFNNGTETFLKIFNSDGLDLKVVSVGTSAVPEPPAVEMIFCAMILVAAGMQGSRRARAKTRA